jgi:hypothetical protein
MSSGFGRGTGGRRAIGLAIQQDILLIVPNVQLVSTSYIKCQTLLGILNGVWQLKLTIVRFSQP